MAKSPPARMLSGMNKAEREAYTALWRGSTALWAPIVLYLGEQMDSKVKRLVRSVEMSNDAVNQLRAEIRYIDEFINSLIPDEKGK